MKLLFPLLDIFFVLNRNKMIIKLSKLDREWFKMILNECNNTECVSKSCETFYEMLD